MIDIENLIVDKVNTALAPLKTTYPKLRVVSDYVEVSADYPIVEVVMADTTTYLPSLDGALQEHEANVFFNINIYTNDKNKKATAKKIANLVDETMEDNLFVRTMFSQLPNMDRSIYRIGMRYRAIVSQPVTIDGVKTYQMYRE